MEKMYFFDSIEGDKRIYQAADFARFHAQIIGNGVSNTENLPDLSVTAKNNMVVGLGAGYMFANGYMYENTESLDLTHGNADINNDRIDRVVIRFDNNPEMRSINAYIKKGVPASNPVAPQLTRNSYVYEMSVAQVRIIAGKSFIEQSQITDERANDEVCGYIPLHNIYRGLNVNELGMVSMPNQSFISTRNNVSPRIQRTASGAVADAIKLHIGPPQTIIEDSQNEVYSVDKFKVKGDGVYHIWFQMAFHLSETSPEDNFTLYVFVNGQESFPLGYSKGEGTFFMSGFDRLKKDDIVELRYTTSSQNKQEKRVNFMRIRMIKVS